VWWSEAERNQVLPIDNRPFSEMVFARPSSIAPRARYTYWPGRAPVPESVAVNVRGRPHTITAHVTVPEALDAVEGVLAVQGSVLGGWSFHLLADGRLVYVHNLAGWRTYRVEAPVSPTGRLAPGDHQLAMRFDPPRVDLSVDGAVVGTGEVRRTVWSRFSLTGAGLTAGWSPDFSPADDDYRGRFAFTGLLHRVDIDVAGEAVVDPEAEALDVIASQ
jgi:arylsulfatase